MHAVRRSPFVLVVLVSMVSLVAAAPAQVARHVAAPPEDISAGLLVLPEPASLEVRSGYALLALDWQPDAGAWMAALELPVERAGPLVLGLVGLGAESWSWSLAAPGDEPRGVELWVQAGLARRSVESLGGEDPRSAVALQLDQAGGGAWRAIVRAPAGAPPSQAWLALRTAGTGDAVLRSHVGTHQRLSDRALSVVASVSGEAGVILPAAGEARIESAGGAWTQPLWDDGLHDDGAAGDGVLGTWIGPLAPGPARVAVQVQGLTAGRASFVRTVHHAFTVEAPAVLLAGWATTEVLDAQRLAIDVALQPLGALQPLHLSAEVWGRDGSGTAVPVAWLSRIEVPVETGGTTSLALHLDGRWLARAGVGVGAGAATGTAGPLELRRVRVQDPDSHVVFAELAALPLPDGPLPASVRAPAGPVTTEMLMGPPPPGSPPITVLPGALGTPPGGGHGGHGGPVGVLPGASQHFAWTHALLLSHGYCSGGNVWPAADFSPPKLVFLDPNQNRSNDEFAQLLAQAGAGKDAFGLVGHSQGGLAALHLLTYYQSGLDFAIGPRRIQSVASPYQGTPLASLGFFACGVNDDMTPSGAPVWLAGIPSWARKEVFYWTTQNSGSVCNFFTDLVLDSPNDGTVEMAKGQLPGANSMGHKSGWCHTTGMSNPANYTDHVRNAEMNAQAAR